MFYPPSVLILQPNQFVNVFNQPLATPTISLQVAPGLPVGIWHRRLYTALNCTVGIEPMRGFPNQVADLAKLAVGIDTLVKLVDAGHDAKDDGIFGEALVRAGVAGAGHDPMPVEEYLAAQRKKQKSNQSFRTTARGLRELYRLMALIDDADDQVEISELGRRAAAFANRPMDAAQIEFWRAVIRNISHVDHRGTSYPYQVLLQLVARKPGITRAKCALALEARNNSADELDRIVALADLPESEIIEQIGETRSNWDNAKKVLPKFAEQLGDVIRSGQSYVIADSPGRANQDQGHEAEAVAAAVAEAKAVVNDGAASRAPRVPRTARKVEGNQIGTGNDADESDEGEPALPMLDPVAAAEAIALRLDRLRRHNALVRRLAIRLQAAGAEIYVDTFDLLAMHADVGILVEVKTLDGSEADERERVRHALSQLLYYESFVTRPVAGAKPIRKIACFENPITEAHRDWLNTQGIGAIWEHEEKFSGDALSATFLRDYLEEFR
jgi:hypothetical protein